MSGLTMVVDGGLCLSKPRHLAKEWRRGLGPGEWLLLCFGAYCTKNVALKPKKSLVLWCILIIQENSHNVYEEAKTSKPNQDEVSDQSLALNT